MLEDENTKLYTYGIKFPPYVTIWPKKYTRASRLHDIREQKI
jgi:hypothetical protein